MHILIISHHYPTPIFPLFGFFCKDQAEALAQKGVKVGVVAPVIVPSGTFKRWSLNRFGIKKSLINGVSSLLLILPPIPKLPAVRRWMSFVVGKKMLGSYIKEYGKPDIIHLQVYLAGDIALYAKEKLKIPLVWTEHLSSVAEGKYSPSEKKLLQLVAGGSSCRIGVSKFFCDTLQKRFDASFIFIPNVYRNMFKLPDRSEKTEPFFFINVSTFSAAKNHFRLIDAFALVQDIPHVNLKLIGDGEYLGTIRDLVNKAGLQHKVIFTGELDAYQVAAELQSSHAYVLSSDIETFNVSIIEAMACGLPVVSTKCGGPESIIENDSLGILVEKNERSLAAGMRQIYVDRDKYDPIFIARYVKATYSYEAVGSQLIEVYKRFIKNHVT